MTDQVYAKLLQIYDLFSLPLFTSEGSNTFSPRDCGYELDEDEIVNGMLVQSPEPFTDQSTPEVEPEDFEVIFGNFLS